MAYRNYFFLLLLVFLISFLFVFYKRKLVKKPWLRRLVSLLTVLSIIILMCAVVLFPDFNSIKTTGKYSYTSSLIELIDESRIENFKNDNSFRKLSVLVHYPDDKTLEYNTLPLIVFSHGGISTITSNLSLYKELASHGYVVVSVGHTYHALSTKIDGKNVYIDSGYMRDLKIENSHLDIKNSHHLFQKWMKLRMEDLNFVVDTFKKNSLEKHNSIYSLIDINKIGVAGHSLGGSAALGVARQRDDIKAVIALESPYMYDIVGVKDSEFLWNTDLYSCHVMNIYSDSGYRLIQDDNKYVQNKKLYYSENVENHYIKGSNHYTLTDLVRTSPILSRILGNGYRRSGYETLEIINNRSLTFFNKYVK